MSYLFHKKLGNVDFYAPSKVHNHKYDAIFFYNDEMHKVALVQLKIVNITINLVIIIF